MEKKSRILYLLQEILIVVVGVLIAVSIGNYKEQLDNESYFKKTLLAIENEIIESQGEIDTVLNKHLKLYEKLENEFGEIEQTIGEFVSRSGGFQVASIKNVSLRFFISNKAELLDFKIISQLLEIEFATDILSGKIRRLTDFSYDNINNKGEEVILKFAYLLSDVIDSEQSLLRAYESFLEENKSQLQQRLVDQ